MGDNDDTLAINLSKATFEEIYKMVLRFKSHKHCHLHNWQVFKMGCSVLTKFRFKKDSIWLKRFYIFSISLARRVQFSNFIGLFCRKSKLPEPKCFTGASFCDTEGPWKVWTKTGGFQIILPKNWWICFQEVIEFIFWGSDLETTIQFLAKRFISPQCHKMKLVWKFFVQAICLLDKTNQ